MRIIKLSEIKKVSAEIEALENNNCKVNANSDVTAESLLNDISVSGINELHADIEKYIYLLETDFQLNDIAMLSRKIIISFLDNIISILRKINTAIKSGLFVEVDGLKFSQQHESFISLFQYRAKVLDVIQNTQKIIRHFNFCCDIDGKPEIFKIQIDE